MSVCTDIQSVASIKDHANVCYNILADEYAIKGRNNCLFH